MTNETKEPERIWVEAQHTRGEDIEYVRADLSETDKYKEYAVGPLTMKWVFEAAKLTNMHDMQAVLDQIEIALTAAPNLSDAKDKRIAELETAIKRQAGAAKTLRNSTLSEVQHIKDNERKEYIASKTLDSEREANAILTEENEALQARIAELETQNRELALQIISSDGQAMDAYGAQREAEQRAEQRAEQLAAQLEASEAKLAKALAALNAMLPAAQQLSNPKMENTIRATLAELKGTDQ